MTPSTGRPTEKRKNKLLKLLAPAVFWLGLWQLAAMAVDQSLLLPSPLQVGARLWELAALSQQLPADSLTLLRAQAWLAHARGDNLQAMEGYRRIVARVPDDAHAGANLALLQAATGQPEQARATLARLQARHADHPLLRRAQAALENPHQ